MEGRPGEGGLVQGGKDIAGILRLESGLRGPHGARLGGNHGTFLATLGEPDRLIRLTGTPSTGSAATIDWNFQGHDCRGQTLQGTFKQAP